MAARLEEAGGSVVYVCRDCKKHWLRITAVESARFKGKIMAATRAIRTLDRADARRVPIVAMTANAFMDDIKRSHEAGMNEHLAKPIEPEKIHQTVRRLLR